VNIVNVYVKKEGLASLFSIMLNCTYSITRFSQAVLTVLLTSEASEKKKNAKQ